jgi:hypothetical protein
MKRQTKRKHRKANKLRGTAPPGTVEEFFAMSEREQDLWNNVGQAVTEMRAGTSRSKAARKFGIDPHQLSELARPGLRKLRNGRWAARTHDRLLRVLVIPTGEGLREIGVRDSRQSTLLGEYWNAVDRYLSTGDASALREFREKYIIDTSGKRIPLLTDLHELDRLGSAGVLSFESIYARAA